MIDSTDNLGLKYIHASLLDSGNDSQILFYCADDESYCDEVARFVSERSPDCVGISLMSRFFHLTASLTEKIRKACNGNIPIIWGGIHPTIDPESCKHHADYVCLGEGERKLVQFVRQLSEDSPEKNVPGILAKTGTEQSVGSTVDDLDSLPFPEYLPRNAWVTDGGAVRPLNLTLFKKHTCHQGTYLPVMTSRGCPFSCSYCCNNLLQRIYGKKIRRRSPENVIAEIEQNLSATGVKFTYVTITDDCFTSHSSEWLETFVQHYRKIGLPVVFRAIPQFVTKEKLDILKEAPCGFALIGLQSGSLRTHSKIYRRKHSREAFLRCARLLDENNIPAVYDVIVDNPYEAQADIEQTVRLVAQLPKSSYVSLFSLTFYKYTELYEMAKSNGIPVDEHFTKNQESWAKSSKETRAIRLASLVNERMALDILHSGKGWRGTFLAMTAFLFLKVLEPLRHLKLTYLSRGGDPVAFALTLLPHARDYARRYFSLSRVNTHKH
jgi:radical SAM superfamily enzyme YgiQ (UPF0313 family)